MGLPDPGLETDISKSARFGDDVLKIELCGPDRPHFSVVDVPGLFQSMLSSIRTIPTNYGFSYLPSRCNAIPNSRGQRNCPEYGARIYTGTKDDYLVSLYIK
jgi:hypothetical protein